MTLHDIQGGAIRPDATGFTLFDVSAFPLVRAHMLGQPVGYAARWMQEMDALLAHGQPFVLLADERPQDESHEDRTARTSWFEANRDRLASICHGCVMVEPGAEKRAAAQLHSETLTKTFGLHFHVAANKEEAQSVALMLVKLGALRMDAAWL
jgi:hypothetical protein